MKRLKTWHYVLLVFLIAGFAWVVATRANSKMQYNEGSIFGTLYHIKYKYHRDLGKEIVEALNKVDNSLSTFNKSSIISKINQNQPTKLDKDFVKVFSLSQDISEKTGGAFDITVAPLVNAWGFGFKNSNNISKHQIDSIKQFVGYKKVSLKDGKIIKQDSRTMLDCSAVAKGYGVDKVAEVFKSKGITDFMIEIGGEVSVAGNNEKGEPWNIGITKPKDGTAEGGEELQAILSITGKALATSGNYRNFYYRDGKKYAHTIDPQTGYPVQHTILSSSVVANDCATADAYATAFMVMGLEKAQECLARTPGIEAYFICTDSNGKYRTWQTKGMENFMDKSH